MSLQVLGSIAARHWEGLRPFIRHGRFIAAAKCDQCGAEREWSTHTVHDPRIAVSRAHKAGWQTGKQLVCPTCREQAKRDKTAAKVATKKEEVQVMATQPEQEKPVPSDAAKRAKRLVYMALEDYYDDARKAYKAGHSDASIAKEIGVAEAFVAKIREEDFGPIAEPAEITALRNQIAKLREDGVAAFAAAEEALSRADRLQRAVNDAVGELSALCRRNGWRA